MGADVSFIISTLWLGRFPAGGETEHGNQTILASHAIPENTFQKRKEEVKKVCFP